MSALSSTKLNNGVKFTQMELAPDNKPQERYRVFKQDGRFLIGRRVYGSITFDIVDDCRTEKFAHARCEALNAGVIK